MRQTVIDPPKELLSNPRSELDWHLLIAGVKFPQNVVQRFEFAGYSDIFGSISIH